MVSTDLHFANPVSDAYSVFRYKGRKAVCQSLQWKISGASPKRRQLSSTARVNSRKRLCSSGSLVYKVGRSNMAGQSMKYIGISVPTKLAVCTENAYSEAPMLKWICCSP